MSEMSVSNREKWRPSRLSLLQNSSFVEDLFARACDFKEVRAAISGMMRLPSRSS